MGRHWAATAEAGGRSRRRRVGRVGGDGEAAEEVGKRVESTAAMGRRWAEEEPTAKAGRRNRRRSRGGWRGVESAQMEHARICGRHQGRARRRRGGVGVGLRQWRGGVSRRRTAAQEEEAHRWGITMDFCAGTTPPALGALLGPPIFLAAKNLLKICFPVTKFPADYVLS
uniref:Uncharacterized protein n=1 Tax=Oryza glumipatula TaxID=40148 RepID=A0A0E0BSH4_9ORYZ